MINDDFFLDPSSWFITCHMCWDVLGTSLKLRHPALAHLLSKFIPYCQREGGRGRDTLQNVADCWADCCSYWSSFGEAWLKDMEQAASFDFGCFHDGFWEADGRLSDTERSALQREARSV